MAKRKANEPLSPATEPESVQRVEAPSEAAPGRISLRVTPGQLAECVSRQKHALIQIISYEHAPPIDGGIMKIVAALDALARIDPELSE